MDDLHDSAFEGASSNDNPHDLRNGDALGFDAFEADATLRVERGRDAGPVDQHAKLERIKQELNSVPALPGVYLWKDKSGQVIYVGKAKQLRARMRQYVNFQDERAKIPLLVDQIDSFDYIVVENEHESLVLEKNLINQHAPFFNADFKDDKSYPFIALTKGDVFPAIKYTREKHRADTKYFGPYTDSRAARDMVDIARRVVPLCATSCADWRRLKRRLEKDPLALMSHDARPCFDAHVGLGPGACCGAITPEEYQANVNKRIERFLSGQHREFVDELQAEMQEAAAELDFERAARIKARIDTINSLTDKQHAVSARNLDADVVGLFREETVAGVHVFMVREGRIINSNEFVLDRGKDVPDDDLLHMFLLRYYDATTSIPHEVILRDEPEDREAMEAWLTEKLASPYGAKVRFCAPRKGEKAELVGMAETNAKHTLMRYKVRTNYDDKRINNALLQLESALALDAPPMRIECFDISTIHGSYTVASMVVFTNGKPDKNQYRRFQDQDAARRGERLPVHAGGDEPPLRARAHGRRALRQQARPHHPRRRQAAAVGGARDVRADGHRRHRDVRLGEARRGAVRALAGHGAGAAQRLGVALPGEAGPRRGAPLRHHVPSRAARQGMTASILDDVTGMGPVRKKALLKHFKSFRNLKERHARRDKRSAGGAHRGGRRAPSGAAAV